MNTRILTEHDSTRMAQIHIRSFPGFFLTTLGSNFLADYYRLALRDPCSYGVGLVKNSQLVGFAIGYPNPKRFYLRLMFRGSHRWAFHGAKLISRRPRALVHLMRSVFSTGTKDTIPDPPSRYILLASIAVDAPEIRGAGTAVLEAWEAVVASHPDIDGVFLTTDAHENGRAIHFYVKNAYVSTAQFTTDRGRAMIRFEKGFSK